MWEHYSHLPSWARRSPRDFWKRVASVGLPGPPLNSSGSASRNRRLTSCGVRQGLRRLTGPVHGPACPHPHSLGRRGAPAKGSRCQDLEGRPLGQDRLGEEDRTGGGAGTGEPAGAPGVGSGQAFPPRQGQDDPGFCLETCEPARDKVRRGGEVKERRGCGSQSLCQEIQPLPSELRVQLQRWRFISHHGTKTNSKWKDQRPKCKT